MNMQQQHACNIEHHVTVRTNQNILPWKSYNGNTMISCTKCISDIFRENKLNTGIGIPTYEEYHPTLIKEGDGSLFPSKGNTQMYQAHKS